MVQHLQRLCVAPASHQLRAFILSLQCSRLCPHTAASASALVCPTSVSSLPPRAASRTDTLIASVQDNYSLSGAFSPLSKLIICAVMLRGRHRGLPVAIDRAVMLPSDLDVVEPRPPSEASMYRNEQSASAKLSTHDSSRPRRLSVLHTLTEAPSRDTPDRDGQDRPMADGDVGA